MSKFKRDMDKARNKIEKAAEKAIRATAIQLFGAIVKSTPVGNPSLWKSPAPKGYIGGSLRGNWQANLITPNVAELKNTDISGSQTVSTGASEINKFTLNDRTIWFSNNLPYAERVEFGWSTQRPQGMVRTNVKSFRPIMDKIARKFKV